MNFKEAKSAALSTLKGNWGGAILVSLVYGILYSLLSSLFGVGALLFGSILMIGYYNTLIQASMTNTFKVESVFSGINNETLGTRILMSVLKSLYIMLWSCLFVIPGLVKSYSYMLAEYIALNNPEMSANECITESRRLMNGHKMRMFLLDLSFFGWAILSVFTFGIGSLFLTPYIAQTRVEYINANILEIKR